MNTKKSNFDNIPKIFLKIGPKPPNDIGKIRLKSSQTAMEIDKKNHRSRRPYGRTDKVNYRAVLHNPKILASTKSKYHKIKTFNCV